MKGNLMTKRITVEAIRKQLWMFLSPEVAADVGLTFDDLKAFINGSKTLPLDKLARLARRMGLS